MGICRVYVGEVHFLEQMDLMGQGLFGDVYDISRGEWKSINKFKPTKILR